MSINWGFDFRTTSGFVTDGANRTYVLPADSYPTTRSIGSDSVTFGWVITGGVDGRDRDNTNDPRLAGINFTTGTSDYFRVDLPAVGDYEIHIALGDASFSAAVGWDFKDTTTILFSIAPTNTSGANKFIDATGTEYSNVTWPGSEKGVTKTFTTTQLRVQDNNAGVNNIIAHLQIVTPSAGGSNFQPAWTKQANQMIGGGIMAG